MKLLVLGASGGIGSWLVRLAAERGHDVTALIRAAAILNAAADVRVIRGEATDRRIVADAVRGQDAVLSAIGQRRTSMSPWSTILSPHDIVEHVTRNLVAVMPSAGVRRLIFVSAGGVRDSVAQCTRAIRWMITRPRLRIAYADLARAEEHAEASALDWLAVRPVTLAPDFLTRRARVVSRYTFLSSVTRRAVADWMIAAVERPEPFIQRTVLLGA